MKTVEISDVTQEEFDDAVQLVISGIKASDPKLDTRLGTVLRSLLVNPEARIEAATSRQIDLVRQASSLKTMKEAEDAGEQVDVEDVNAVLSNFNIRASSGTRAEGVVKISVEDGTKTYSVAQDTEFRTSDGLVFRSTIPVTAALEPGVDAASPLYEGAVSYFFLVPVAAKEVGITYNIQQGTSLRMNASLFTFIGAEAYKSFNGGSDVSDIGNMIEMIPSGLSIRGFVNKSACEGMLRDKFDDGQYPIVACSTVGYGNSAQRRDKHNAFGVGVGGRIDLYVRNFGDLCTVTKVVSGSRRWVMDGGTLSRVDYVIDVTPEDFPGSCWVKDVRCVDSEEDDGRGVNSSLEFSCARTAVGVDSTWHDFDVRDNASEIFNTVWQGLQVTAEEVPPDGDDGADDTWSESRLFSVTVYCLPQAQLLQNYVDRDSVRSVSTDVVVRCPVICNVEVKASVVYDVDNPMDVDGAKYKIRKYINGLGFVGSLTRSEIVHILKSCGAVSVDLDKKDMLYGTLHDAFGREFKLSGDALMLDGLAEDAAMLTKDTAIFAVEPENIQITLTPNR